MEGSAGEAASGAKEPSHDRGSNAQAGGGFGDKFRLKPPTVLTRAASSTGGLPSSTPSVYDEGSRNLLSGPLLPSPMVASPFLPWRGLSSSSLTPLSALTFSSELSGTVEAPGVTGGTKRELEADEPAAAAGYQRVRQRTEQEGGGPLSKPPVNTSPSSWIQSLWGSQFPGDEGGSSAPGGAPAASGAANFSAPHQMLAPAATAALPSIAQQAPIAATATATSSKRRAPRPRAQPKQEDWLEGASEPTHSSDGGGGGLAALAHAAAAGGGVGIAQGTRAHRRSGGGGGPRLEVPAVPRSLGRARHDPDAHDEEWREADEGHRAESEDDGSGPEESFRLDPALWTVAPRLVECTAGDCVYRDQRTRQSLRKHYHANCAHLHRDGPKRGMRFHHHQLEKIRKHQRSHNNAAASGRGSVGGNAAAVAAAAAAANHEAATSAAAAAVAAAAVAHAHAQAQAAAAAAVAAGGIDVEADFDGAYDGGAAAATAAAGAATAAAPSLLLAHEYDVRLQPWSAQESARLQDLVSQHGQSHWQQVADGLPGRNASECMMQWRKVAKKVVKGVGSWTGDEDARLIALSGVFGTKWAKIAEHMPGRVPKQCRERYLNHLDPNLSKDAWSEAEDLQLLQLHESFDNKWAEITRRMTGRSYNDVKNRLTLLQRRSRVSAGDQRGAAGGVGSGQSAASGAGGSSGSGGGVKEEDYGAPEGHNDGLGGAWDAGLEEQEEFEVAGGGGSSSGAPRHGGDVDY